MDGEDISAAKYFIDSHLYNTLFRGIDIDTYLFPYIPYKSDDETFISQSGSYYIPKDVSISLAVHENKINER
jgi:hypothetical protein